MVSPSLMANCGSASGGIFGTNAGAPYYSANFIEPHFLNRSQCFLIFLEEINKKEDLIENELGTYPIDNILK